MPSRGAGDRTTAHLRAEPGAAPRGRWTWSKSTFPDSQGGAVKAEATVIAAYLTLAVTVVGVIALS